MDNIHKNRTVLVFHKIIELYTEYHNEDVNWSTNIRNFIEAESKNIEELDDDVFESNYHIAENIFHLFVNKLDIDEDEFDGPNDLHPSEWILFDMIVIHHYINTK